MSSPVGRYPMGWRYAIPAIIDRAYAPLICLRGLIWKICAIAHPKAGALNFPVNLAQCLGSAMRTSERYVLCVPLEFTRESWPDNSTQSKGPLATSFGGK